MSSWSRHRIGKHHDSHLVLSTLLYALATGAKPHIFHSDQVNEFMAQRCTQYLEQHGIRVSVSDVASPWQNGYQESFFGRFKQEFGGIDRFESPGELFEAIHHHIHYYTTTITVFTLRSRCHLPFSLPTLSQTLVFNN